MIYLFEWLPNINVTDEVDHVHKNTQRNGYFAKTRSCFLRIVIAPPSSDVQSPDY